MAESILSPKKPNKNKDCDGNSFESDLCDGDLRENKKKFADRKPSTFVKSFADCQKSCWAKKRVYVDKD